MTRSVEQRLAALEAALANPQALRNLLERTFDPRGEEPRIIDADGNTLDFQGAIQFLNATSVVDGANQRIVVTPTGGGGSGVALRFSDDGSLAADEQLVYAAESGAARGIFRESTATVGGTQRVVTTRLSEDTSSSSVPVVESTWTNDSTTGDRSWQLALRDVPAGTGAISSVSGQANAAHTNNDTVLTTRNPSGNVASASLDASSSAGSAVVTANGQSGAGNAGVSTTVNGITRRVYTDGGTSHFLQCAVPVTGAPMRRVFRDVAGSLGSIAAGATATLTVTDVFPAPVVINALVGGMYDLLVPASAAGVELCLWRWHTSGADVVITVHNTDTVAHTPYFAGMAINAS